MKPRRSYDETEASRVKPAPEPLGGLWAQPAADPEPEPLLSSLPWAAQSEAERRAQRMRWQERLTPLLDAMLAARDTTYGITAAELVDEAMCPKLHQGFGVILPPGLRVEHPRVFSFVGPWLAQLARGGKLGRKMARLEGHGAIHLRREATRDEAHGNDGLIYTRAAA